MGLLTSSSPWPMASASSLLAFWGSWRALGAALLVTVMAWYAVKALVWTWWTPRRLERNLRAQGLKGTPYRFLNGDLKENTRLLKEVRAKPMLLFSHDIVPRITPLFYNAMKQYGKISYTWFGPVPRVTISDPDLVREVLSNKFGHFQKPESSPLIKLLVTGVAGYEGEKWAKHRKILNPAFHMEKLKRMLPAFHVCCSELVERWENLVDSSGSNELDVWPELQSFTGDVISRSAFGSSYVEGRRIFQLQTEQIELVVQAAQSVYIPGYRFLPTPKNNRRKEIEKEVRSLLKVIIGKRQRAIKNGESNNDDLLGILIESNDNYFNEDGKKSNGMTVDDVIEECKLFYFAGQETTSELLTWTMILLSMYPSWQEKAREEIFQVFGNNQPDYDGLSRLKIVTMILNEVLRLYPSIVFLNRMTYKTMKLGDVTYPAGVLLVLPIICLHHDPYYWGKDAVEFKPERFAEGVSKASKNQAFFPFGGGPRICIGQNFAFLEAKMGLSMMLQRFSFELSPSYIHAPRTLLTLQPQHGAQLRLRKISRQSG